MLSLQMFHESYPPAYVVPTMFIGLVCMVSTRRLQRIGDLAAGTMVVSEKRKVNPLNQPPDDIRAFGLAELIPPSYEVGSSLAQAVGQYMETRKRLSPRRREEIASRIAGPLFKKFDMLPDTASICYFALSMSKSIFQTLRGKKASGNAFSSSRYSANNIADEEGPLLQASHSTSHGAEAATTQDPVIREIPEANGE